MKKSKIWGIFWVIVVLALVGGGGFYFFKIRPSGSDISTSTQLYTVKYGNLTETVSAAGSIVYATKEQLSFGNSGTVSEIDVKLGDAIKEGTVLAKLDPASLLGLQKSVTQATINLNSAQDSLDKALDTSQAELAVITAQQGVANAQAELVKAQDPYSDVDFIKAEMAVTDAETTLTGLQNDLDSLLNPSAVAIAQAQLAVDNAQQSLQNAQEDLHKALTASEIYWLTVDQKTQQVTIAEDNLAVAQSNFNDLKSPDPKLIEQKKNQIIIAHANLDDAKAALAGMTVDPLAVQQKQIQLTVAENTLEKAEADLENIKNGSTPDIQLLKLNLDTAQSALDTATAKLDYGTIVAPFDGIISAIAVSVGQSVNDTTEILEITDPASISVSAVLDEIDVARVSLGQVASISVDALSGARLSGEISSISDTARTQSGIVSYPVTVGLRNTQQAGLREGMSSTVKITVQNLSHVLLVPNQAIGGSLVNPVVNVVVNGVTEERPVTLGASDGNSTEIVDGLQEGDMVVIETVKTNNPPATVTTSQTTTTGNFQNRGSGVNPTRDTTPTIPIFPTTATTRTRQSFN